MKKVRKKCGCTILTVLLALLPVQVAADEPASLSSAADVSKGLFYQSTFDEKKSAVLQMDTLLQFTNDSGFNRIYYSFSSETEQKSLSLPMVRLRSDQERTLEELSYLTPLLEEKRISLSLVLDPFSLSPSHPAFRFVKTVTDHGSSIAVWDGESLHLDPAQEQNQALAQWDLQKRLAAGSIADELLMPNTAFLSPAQDGLKDSQVSQAQKIWKESAVEGFLFLFHMTRLFPPRHQIPVYYLPLGYCLKHWWKISWLIRSILRWTKILWIMKKKPCNGTPGPMAFRLFPACKAPLLILAVRNSISAVRFFC